MKKLAIYIFLTFSGIMFSKAQIQYGPRVFLGTSELGGKSTNSFAFGGGLFVKAELLDNFGIQVEGNYLFQTATEEAKDASGKVVGNYLYSMPSIQIPLLVYFKFSQHLYAILGPQISLPRNGKSVYTPNSGPTVTKDLNAGSFGPGFVFGLMVMLPSNLDLSLRYSLTSGDPLAGQSSLISISAGYPIKW